MLSVIIICCGYFKKYFRFIIYKHKIGRIFPTTIKRIISTVIFVIPTNKIFSYFFLIFKIHKYPYKNLIFPSLHPIRSISTAVQAIPGRTFFRTRTVTLLTRDVSKTS